MKKTTKIILFILLLLLLGLIGISWIVWNGIGFWGVPQTGAEALILS